MAGPDRYEIDGRIDGGGMGEILAVRDQRLDRTVVMKVLREILADNPEARARFQAEAWLTARLQHPGILPVHDLGELPDGRPFFVMKDARTPEPEGLRVRTLGRVIGEVHRASVGEDWGTTEDGWSFPRLVEAFRRACEAVAFAHSQRVIHRDLKPDNVLVGHFGEVLVIDWGLARPLGDALRDAPPVPEREGSIRGTPAYMPPEQAQGRLAGLDARADVYALGAILYEVLAGRPPYEGRDPRAVLRQVLAGPPDPPGQALRSEVPGTTIGWSFDGLDEGPSGRARLRPPVPAELQAICLRAMDRDPAGRYPDAQALAAAIAAWSEGSQRRARALEVVEQADALAPELVALRREAQALRAEARARLERTPPWAPVQDKAPAWAQEDRATRLERRAEAREVQYTQLLQAALTYVPELREAHERLADHHGRLLRQAEARGDLAEGARLELLLRSHDTGRYTAWLDGSGTLSLSTDPPASRVLLERYEEHERRLRAVPDRILGPAPIERIPLPMGRYRLVLEAPGRPPTRWPFRVGRAEHVEVVPPGATGGRPVRLHGGDPPGPETCFVPEGWMLAGGDPDAPGAGPAQRVWVDGFHLCVHPVTNRDYLVFLDDLVAQGREAEALAWAPRERAGTAGEAGALVYGRTPTGGFELVPDADGDTWDPDWPVVLVDWFGARAYAAWLAARSGLPWRLPRELEWEKAARGADGRRFPWGDHFDATWACLRESHPHQPLPARIDAWPTDESPYGARGLAGNVRDWCLDPWRPGGPALDGGRPAPLPPGDEGPRVIRGGNWNGGIAYARAASRDGDAPTARTAFVGFRLARSPAP